MIRHTQASGFTLIELLVVIAIIGLLSSTILVSLNSARFKAQETAIKSQMEQMARLMALEYNETGSYQGLSPQNWASHDHACAGFNVSGNYAAQFIKMCQEIYAIDPYEWSFFSGVSNSVSGHDVSSYSLIAWLPYTGIYYCLGSSGRSSTDTGTGVNAWTSPGCYANP